jgi:hypothetical protein
MTRAGRRWDDDPWPDDNSSEPDLGTSAWRRWRGPLAVTLFTAAMLAGSLYVAVGAMTGYRAARNQRPLSCVVQAREALIHRVQREVACEVGRRVK